MLASGAKNIEGGRGVRFFLIRKISFKMNIEYKEYFRMGWKRMLDYVERNCLGYNHSVKRNYVIKLYCEKVGLAIPFKKQRVGFVTKELKRNGSPIYLKGEFTIIRTKVKTKKKSKRQKKVEKEQRKVDYNKYLRSSEWKTFKSGLIKIRGNKCEKCGKTNVVLDGHHLTYERFTKELPRDVVLLCRSCHDEVHSSPKSKYNPENDDEDIPAYEYANLVDTISFNEAMYEL